MNYSKYSIIAFLALMILGSCSQGGSDYIVTIHTKFGGMKVILYEETPKHKANFLELARNDEYDSTIFHRVINGFMIQGGDVYANEEEKETEDDKIDAEIVDKFLHTKGSLAAARMGDQENPDRKSSNCQFYIVHGTKFTEDQLITDARKLNEAISKLLQDDKYEDLRNQFIELQQQENFQAMNELAIANRDLVEDELGVSVTKDISDRRLEAYTSSAGAPHLDGAYTIFGRVVEGLDVIDEIASLQTNNQGKPFEDVYMTMDVEKVDKSFITSEYGYEYPK